MGFNLLCIRVTFWWIEETLFCYRSLFWKQLYMRFITNYIEYYAKTNSLIPPWKTLRESVECFYPSLNINPPRIGAKFQKSINYIRIFKAGQTSTQPIVHPVLPTIHTVQYTVYYTVHWSVKSQKQHWSAVSRSRIILTNLRFRVGEMRAPAPTFSNGLFSAKLQHLYILALARKMMRLCKTDFSQNIACNNCTVYCCLHYCYCSWTCLPPLQPIAFSDTKRRSYSLGLL
jgi:hypothetical protein